MTQKAGAAKAVLTNILPNEIILWHLLHSGKQVNVLVVDIDPQQTNTAKRKRDIEQLSYKETSPEFLAMDLGQKTEIGQFQLRIAHRRRIQNLQNAICRSGKRHTNIQSIGEYTVSGI